MAAAEHENDALRTLDSALRGSDLGVLLRASEPERYRLLAAALLKLAEFQAQRVAAGDGPEQARLASLGKKLDGLAAEKALLEDALAVAREALRARTQELELKQQRTEELERRLADQAAQRQADQKRIAEAETQAAARASRVHDLQNQLEAERLKLQRAECVAADRAPVDALEETRRSLTAQLEESRQAREQLRADKDAELERLRGELRAAQARSGPDALLAELWERLARARLARGGIRPTTAAAARLAEVFVLLSRFVHDFDQSMRPILAEFTQHEPGIRCAWEAYTRLPGPSDVVHDVVDPEYARSAAVLWNRLQRFKQFLTAALIGSDAAVHSISHELQQHLSRGPAGQGPDRNRRISEYLKADGPELFQACIRELFSRKVSEAYQLPAK